ncbi:hypothetical protein Pmani_027326 [Petrolisthes manimaculis]|uniref:Uncharacterized protein n=1 Tax=Petrolisthes manimaculis TaxID=1843537 RepID=A0AAE1P4H2_9EUCA|nr:hypothetical protein Pmani_027326 [Petrolisthes manimaculis]
MELVPPMMVVLAASLATILLMALILILILRRRSRSTPRLDTQLQQVRLQEKVQALDSDTTTPTEATGPIHNSVTRPLFRQVHIGAVTPSLACDVTSQPASDVQPGWIEPKTVNGSSPKNNIDKKTQTHSGYMRRHRRRTRAPGGSDYSSGSEVAGGSGRSSAGGGGRGVVVQGEEGKDTVPSAMLGMRRTGGRRDPSTLTLHQESCLVVLSDGTAYISPCGGGMAEMGGVAGLGSMADMAGVNGMTDIGDMTDMSDETSQRTREMTSVVDTDEMEDMSEIADRSDEAGMNFTDDAGMVLLPSDINNTTTGLCAMDVTPDVDNGTRMGVVMNSCGEAGGVYVMMDVVGMVGGEDTGMLVEPVMSMEPGVNAVLEMGMQSGVRIDPGMDIEHVNMTMQEPPRVATGEPQGVRSRMGSDMEDTAGVGMESEQGIDIRMDMEPQGDLSSTTRLTLSSHDPSHPPHTPPRSHHDHHHHHHHHHPHHPHPHHHHHHQGPHSSRRGSSTSHEEGPTRKCSESVSVL